MRGPAPRANKREWELQTHQRYGVAHIRPRGAPECSTSLTSSCALCVPCLRLFLRMTRMGPSVDCHIRDVPRRHRSHPYGWRMPWSVGGQDDDDILGLPGSGFKMTTFLSPGTLLRIPLTQKWVRKKMFLNTSVEETQHKCVRSSRWVCGRLYQGITGQDWGYESWGQPMDVTVEGTTLWWDNMYQDLR